MRMSMYFDTQSAQLREKFFDLLLFRVSSHVSQIFISGPSQNLVNHARKFIGDGYLGLVFGAEAE